MESFFVRFKNVLVLVAILLVQTIGLAIQVRRPVESGVPDGHNVMLLRYWAESTVAPFEKFFHGIGYNVRHGWSNYVDLRHTHQQNLDLQQEVARLRLEQSEFAEDAMQGRRLKTMLDFQQHYVTKTVAAQVIGTSGSDLARVVYIDKGAKDGLKTDQAVITPDGIVGKLRDVFPHTAQVLLISDQTSGAGVLLATTRIRAILRGTTTGRVVINNLTQDQRIKSGEQVLTSGGDQVYPRGLPVGTIESITPDAEHQPYTLIELKPAANLNQLEEVLVITGTESDLTDTAKDDLARGVATAAERAEEKQKREAEQQAAAEEAARSAAQIVADRLPSLHDADQPEGTQPAAADATAAQPGGPVPHPLPTVHTDRYTPGAAPPAAALRPGAQDHNPAPVATPTAAPAHSSAPSAFSTDTTSDGQQAAPRVRKPATVPPPTPPADTTAPNL